MPVKGGGKKGNISKPYGLLGSVCIILNPASGITIEPDHPLFIEIEGQRVPFFVEECEMVSENQVVVKFEFINSVEEARKICGYDIHMDQKAANSSEDQGPDLNSIVGYKAIDHNLGFLGPIADFIQNEMNPVFLVEYKGRELMIPAAEEIIQHINPENQTIYFALPEGLTEL